MLRVPSYTVQGVLPSSSKMLIVTMKILAINYREQMTIWRGGEPASYPFQFFSNSYITLKGRAKLGLTQSKTVHEIFQSN